MSDVGDPRARAEVEEVVEAVFVDVHPVGARREVESSDGAGPPLSPSGGSSPRPGPYGRKAEAVAEVVEVVASGVEGVGATLRAVGRKEVGDRVGRAVETARRASSVVVEAGRGADAVVEGWGRLRKAWGKLAEHLPKGKTRRAEPRTTRGGVRPRKRKPGDEPEEGDGPCSS